MTLSLIQVLNSYFKEDLSSYFKEDLSVEDYSSLYRDLMNGVTHRSPFCGCPACIYPKSRKINRDNFYMAWLLYQTAERKKLKNQRIDLRYQWKKAIKLMFDISGKKYKIPFCRNIGNKYNIQNITSRYSLLIVKRLRDKYLDDMWISSPGVKYLQNIRDSLHAQKMQKIKEGKLYYRFQKRLFEFIKENRALTFHDLCKHFSGKRIRQILLEIGLPVPYGNGIIIGILNKRIAFYVGEDIPITETIEKLQSISKKRGYGSLKLIAQVLEMFSRRIKIPAQLHMQSGLNLEENKKPLFLEEKGKSWFVTAEGMKSIIEWPEKKT